MTTYDVTKKGAGFYCITNFCVLIFKTDLFCFNRKVEFPWTYLKIRGLINHLFRYECESKVV